MATPESFSQHHSGRLKVRGQAPLYTVHPVQQNKWLRALIQPSLGAMPSLLKSMLRAIETDSHGRGGLFGLVTVQLNRTDTPLFRGSILTSHKHVENSHGRGGVLGLATVQLLFMLQSQSFEGVHILNMFKTSPEILHHIAH